MNWTISVNGEDLTYEEFCEKYMDKDVKCNAEKRIDRLEKRIEKLEKHAKRIWDI